MTSDVMINEVRKYRVTDYFRVLLLLLLVPLILLQLLQLLHGSLFVQILAWRLAILMSFAWFYQFLPANTGTAP
jgi:hypothetical protein